MRSDLFVHGAVLSAEVREFDGQRTRLFRDWLECSTPTTQVLPARVMSRRHVFVLILFLHQSLTLPPVSARDDAREQKVYERYLSLLRRNPRQGTALTRVLKWHSDHKSLDAFQKELESAVQDSPADGASWMLLGLVAEERSNYATALDAYKNA